ncbi:MAG TPA: cell division protein ZipA C-terminal FtsZ-binding domain-containing protein [Gammaproteobacteria bacterium]|nr:cell division protein ZipA C-terminal FtsZ-binding domain-containing protein [Gammaproteobacteria bacterium]
MSELRWIILGIGVVVIAAVYFFSRRKKDHGEPREALPPRRAEAEPYLGGFDSKAVSGAIAAEPDAAPAVRQPDVTHQRAAPAPADDQLILTVHVIARTDAGFAADAVATALAAAGLRFGRYGIYHCAGDDGTDWFSAANMVEPGRFPEPGSDETTPGITLFMMMPGLAQPHQALDTLLAAARRLAADLDADLADSRRKPFTAQAAQRMREQVAEFHARNTSLNMAPLPSGEGLG